MGATQTKDRMFARDLSWVTTFEIGKKLDVENTRGTDYRAFAVAVGMGRGDISLISKNAQPTEEIFKWWETQKDATVQNLQKIFRDLRRDDALEILNKDPKVAQPGAGIENTEDGQASTSLASKFSKWVSSLFNTQQICVQAVAMFDKRRKSVVVVFGKEDLFKGKETCDVEECKEQCGNGYIIGQISCARFLKKGTGVHVTLLPVGEIFPDISLDFEQLRDKSYVWGYALPRLGFVDQVTLALQENNGRKDWATLARIPRNKPVDEKDAGQEEEVEEGPSTSVAAFDARDALVLIIGLIMGIMGICACLGAIGKMK